MLELNEYPIALIVPKLQLSNNQRNTILSFCKSVKFLYSGCKETLQSGLQGLFIVSIQDTNHKPVD